MAALKQAVIRTLTMGLLLVMALGVEGNKKQNKPYDHFITKCVPNESISAIMAVPTDKKDHIWSVQCSPLPGKRKVIDCKWPDKIEHKLDEPYVFQCPEERYISAVNSHYDMEKKDRHFEFACCKVENSYMHECSITPWDQPSPTTPKYFKIPKDMVFRGMISYFDPKTRYRRFRLLFCRLGQSD